jgi:nitrate reductase beta subunit
MKIRAQIGMVLNLDKCIGCHTCSVTCKNVWTSREGVEYAWFNNVETKPGIGYPKDWENQKRWNGGWVRDAGGSIRPGRQVAAAGEDLRQPDLPEIDDYYEPFTFDYEHLQKAGESKAFPTARPRSLISGQRMEKIEWGPNWEEILGGEFAKRRRLQLRRRPEGDLRPVRKHLHDVSAAAVRALPQPDLRRGLPLRRDLQARGRRHRPDRSGKVPRLAHVRLGLPYKKIYYNWKTGKAEKCIFCYPRIEAGQPTVCSETCVGRIRYLGVMLYDADRIEEAAAAENVRTSIRRSSISSSTQRSGGDRTGA